MKRSDNPELFDDYQYLQTLYMNLKNTPAQQVYAGLPEIEAFIAKSADMSMLERRMSDVLAGIPLTVQRWIEELEMALNKGV